ncbi:MAG TPA: antitoxin family protein [Bryobacteraceae bacterium]|nr:antitoxin family protein [Bryobacteraceae bacterium]
MTVRVVYHGGAFIPKGQLTFEEGTEGLVVLDQPEMEFVVDPEERRRLLADLVADMRRNPLPPNSPKLTRDQMHERG